MIYDFNVLALSVIATVGATQAIKYLSDSYSVWAKLVPKWFSQHPRITTLIVSIVSSVVASVRGGFGLEYITDSWVKFAGFVVANTVISAIVYNNIVKKPQA